jgi:uncharacterized protein YqkB
MINLFGRFQYPCKGNGKSELHVSGNSSVSGSELFQMRDQLEAELIPILIEDGTACLFSDSLGSMGSAFNNSRQSMVTI